jgi:hypothetical protein
MNNISQLESEDTGDSQQNVQNDNTTMLKNVKNNLINFNYFF